MQENPSNSLQPAKESALFSIGESVGLGISILLAVYLGQSSMCHLQHSGRVVSELSLTSWGAWIDPLQPCFSLLLLALPMRLVVTRAFKRVYDRQPKASVKERIGVFGRVVLRLALIWGLGCCLLGAIVTTWNSDGSFWQYFSAGFMAWMRGGLFFGILMWFIFEKSCMRREAACTPTSENVAS